MKKYFIYILLIIIWVFSFYNCNANTYILWAAWNNKTQIWLKSWVWTNCSTNWCNITSWNDESGRSRHWTVSNWAWWYVKYNLTDTLNFNPTIELKTSQINLAKTARFKNYTVFYVLKWKDIWNSSTLFSDWTREWRFEQWNDSGKYWYTYRPLSDNYKSNISTIWDKYQILSFNCPSSFSVNASVQLWSWKYTHPSWYIWINTYLWLSKFSNNSSDTWHFYIAELLWYSSTLDAVNTNKVESYFAIKYGMTLDQTSPTNYTLSNWSIAWNAWNAWTYKYDITWIWRDDASSLNQKKSQTINNSWDIIVWINWNSFTNNLNSLIWANNQASTWSWTTTDAPNYYKRIDREWRFSEIWDVWNLIISYPNSSLASSVSSSWWLLMFVDDDWIFNSWTSIFTWSLNSTTNNWDFSVNISNWQYITFWYNNDLTPPTITYNSISSWALLPKWDYTFKFSYQDQVSGVNATWITYSLSKWNPLTSSYWENIAPNYISSVVMEEAANIQIINLPYWRYQLEIKVPDLAWNLSSYKTTFYVDEVEFIINTWSVNIWKLLINSKNFSPELIITVKTLWAVNKLFMSQNWDFSNSWTVLNNWNWTSWFGYDKFPYTNNINLINQNEIIWSNSLSINTSWEKNTYTYKVKLWVLFDDLELSSWNYSTKLNFLLQLNY